MPPRPNALLAPAGRALDLARRRLDHVGSGGRRLAAPGRPAKRPVDVGQDDEQIGADQVDDHRGEVVVVAEADLLGRDRVVLVHDRHDAEVEQRRAACAARSGSARGRRGPARVSSTCATCAPVPREARAGRSRRGRSGRPRRRPASRGSSARGAFQPSRRLPHRDRARGDDDDLAARRRAARRLGGELAEHARAQLRRRGERRAAHLHDDARARAAAARPRRRASCARLSRRIELLRARRASRAAARRCLRRWRRRLRSTAAAARARARLRRGSSGGAVGEQVDLVQQRRSRGVRPSAGSWARARARIAS